MLVGSQPLLLETKKEEEDRSNIVCSSVGPPGSIRVTLFGPRAAAATDRGKAKAWDKLAAFYDACAQVEIDEYRDYDKARWIARTVHDPLSARWTVHDPTVAAG